MELGADSRLYASNIAVDNTTPARIFGQIGFANFPPMPTDDLFTVPYQTTTNLPVLYNDQDKDSPFTIDLAFSVIAPGTPTINATSTGIDYTPYEGFYGLGKVMYRVTDGIATNFANATVTIFGPPLATDSVIIPVGSSSPGCESSLKCYTPSSIIVPVGTQVTWRNIDVPAHTITSGDPGRGPNGFFDSGLIFSESSFLRYVALRS